MQTPDSSATKHSLTMTQRQYIDSRFSENVGDYMKSIIETLSDINIELMNIRAKISITSYRIAKIEDAIQKDDKAPQLPLPLDGHLLEKDKA